MTIYIQNKSESFIIISQTINPKDSILYNIIQCFGKIIQIAKHSQEIQHISEYLIRKLAEDNSSKTKY